MAWKDPEAEAEMEGCPLTAPDWEFTELETAKAFHYPGITAWYAEDPARRGRLVAHEIERSKREAFLIDWRKKKKPAAGSASGGGGFYSSMRDKFCKPPSPPG